jgi:hypothetical protein
MTDEIKKNAKKMFSYILKDITNKNQLANLYNTVEARGYKSLIVKQWEKEVGSKKEFIKFLENRNCY